MTDSPALLTKEFESALAKLRAHTDPHISYAIISHDEAAALLQHIAALEQRVEAMEWRPIETAPRDGSWCLFLRKHRPFPLLAKYDPVYGEFEDQSGDHVHDLIYWMPLPPAYRSPEVP